MSAFRPKLGISLACLVAFGGVVCQDKAFANELGLPVHDVRVIVSGRQSDQRIAIYGDVSLVQRRSMIINDHADAAKTMGVDIKRMRVTERQTLLHQVLAHRSGHSPAVMILTGYLVRGRLEADAAYAFVP